MDKRTKRLIAGWLMHFAAIFILTIGFNTVVYIYNSSIDGYYQANADHSATTNWQYFLHQLLGHAGDQLVFLVFTLLTETTYVFLLDRLKMISYVIACVLVGTLSFILLLGLNWYNFSKSHHLLGATVLIWYSAAYALLYSFIRDYFHNIALKKDIQLQQSKNELDGLKSQLNPHFLFNSLNYLYGSALNERASTTADGIDKLSAMMRYTITGVHENFVSLQDEITFINNYLTLQQARIPQTDNIKINIDIPTISTNLEIAPLILLPFIENAFKYGVSVDKPCHIDLKIGLRDNTINLHLINSIIGHQSQIAGNNTGIKNTIKRLDLLYTGNYELTHKTIGDLYKVDLKIKLKP